MKKKIALMLSAVMILALAFSVTGCGGGGDAEGVNVEGDTIKIGVFEPTTGENGGGGMQEVLGIRYANQLNPTVEVGGKTYNIELVEVDNQSDKTAAVTAAQQLISDGVVGVLGSYGSGVAIAAGDTFKTAAVPAIGCSCTNPQVTSDNDFYFRVCFLDPFQGTVMASFASNELKVKKAAIYIDNTSDYAKGLAQFFKENFIKNGGQVVIEEAYLQKDTDFKSTLTKIKAAQPDFIYIPGYYQEVGLIVKQAREMGITVPMAGGDGWDSAKLPEIAGKAALENTFFSSLYSPDDTSDLNKEFVAEYKKAYNTNPDVFAALAYDSTLLVAKAIEDAGSADPAKIAEAMAKIKGFKGVSGEVTFNEQHNPIKSAVIIEHKDGKQTFKTKVNP